LISIIFLSQTCNADLKLRMHLDLKPRVKEDSWNN